MLNSYDIKLYQNKCMAREISCNCFVFCCLASPGFEGSPDFDGLLKETG